MRSNNNNESANPRRTCSCWRVHGAWLVNGIYAVASFPGSPSFRAIIPRMTFDPPVGKAEGEPGRFCHMTSVMLRHPYIRYRREGGSKVVRGIIARKEGEPGNEANVRHHTVFLLPCMAISMLPVIILC